MRALDETLSPDHRRVSTREPAELHFRRMNTAFLPPEGEAPKLRAQPEKPCRFDVYRADQVRTSSVLFAGGDWRWRLSDAAGLTLVEAGGYRSEDDCRKAVTLLQRHVPVASPSARA